MRSYRVYRVRGLFGEVEVSARDGQIRVGPAVVVDEAGAEELKGALDAALVDLSRASRASASPEGSGDAG